jgi:hypothetical protein
MRFLITTLAEYQTDFWLQVGMRLRGLGHGVSFLSFDDRSSETLSKAGFEVFSGTAETDTPLVGDPTVDSSFFSGFGIKDINHWLGHERLAFGQHDSGAMLRKLARALITADRACRSLAGSETVVVVQELGGFLSVIGTFFAARARGLHNWFIEPSFFRGRMFLLEDSFSSMAITRGAPDRIVPADLARYLDETIEAGKIVVPLKDRHQYTTATRKILNLRNLRRLAEKVSDKYLRGKRQEFGHIANHVATHLKMLYNSRRLSRHYTPLDGIGSFIYYPLHVPGDMALTLRSPHLLDQIALIDYLCRAVPATHKVVIKEHPAMIGAIDAGRLIELSNRHDNLVMLRPSTNNYAVIRRSDAVVSVNSKSGAEAGLVGKPVVTLGDAFYRDAPFSTAVDRLQELPACIERLVGGGSPPPARPEDVRRYFADVWDQSFPGELYVSDDANVARFVDSLLAAIVR